jgi:hypothetical protein
VARANAIRPYGLETDCNLFIASLKSVTCPEMVIVFPVCANALNPETNISTDNKNFFIVLFIYVFIT